MPDFFAYELAEAFRLAGCPLCRVVTADEERWMESFWREGKSGRDARLAFYAAGGFCRRHAWLLHRSVAGAGAAIADVYGALADRDLEWFDKVLSRRRREVRLGRRSPCPACLAADDAVGRKAYFLAGLLRTGEARALYRASDGLCFRHLARTLEETAAEDDETAAFLLEDWRDRLARVRAQLAEFDRKRDVRYADEPKGPEQDAWTDVIRRYVGENL
jgi:hypothetical protein